MNARQAAFFRQARSDWEVFRYLRQAGPGGLSGWRRWAARRLGFTAPVLPPCHELHYLEMCTEKLAKAYYRVDLRTGHEAFRRFITDLTGNSNAVAPLGFGSVFELSRWQRSVAGIVQAIEDLAPAIADRKNLPNPEYPWPRNNPTTAPADHPFTAEVYDYLDAQARGPEPPFLTLLGRMVGTMQAAGWHL